MSCVHCTAVPAFRRLGEEEERGIKGKERKRFINYVVERVRRREPTEPAREKTQSFFERRTTMPCYIYRCYFPPNRPTGLLFFHLPHLRQPQFRKPPCRRAESTTYPSSSSIPFLALPKSGLPAFFYRLSPLHSSTRLQ